MADVIDDPILNRPFEEPARHFRFDEDGITSQVIETRRPGSYFIRTALDDPDMASDKPRVDLPVEEMIALAKLYGVRELAVFGSVLRPDFRPDSDVDVLGTSSRTPRSDCSSSSASRTS